MKLITRDTDYATRALVFIAKNKQKIVSVSELVDNLDVPKPFLRKILQTLNRSHLLVSYKGQGGGFRLARKPNKIFLLDLMNIFQGNFKLNECILKNHRCPDMRKCSLRKKIDGIENYIMHKLKNISMASLLR